MNYFSRLSIFGLSIIGLSVSVLSLMSNTIFAASIDDGELGFTEQQFYIPADAGKIILADLSANGLADILVPIDNSIRIYFHSDNGFDFDNGYSEIEFPGTAIGWDISSGDELTGSGILALIDGREVLHWAVDDSTILDPEVLKTGLSGFIGKGANRLHFSQDVNSDGSKDLVIPGAGQLNLYINDGIGGYQDSIAVQSTVNIRSNLDGSELERRIGQAVRIPRLDLRDVNNDSLPDLISRSDERLDVFLANNTEGSYFPRSPSYSLDIEEIEERLGEFDIDNLDFSNLTGVLALTHEEILEDIDGDNIDDLLLREGGKVSLYGGSSEGMDLEQPRQVLRSGGNVLTTFLYDEDGDDLKDLWLWRVEPISVGDIFLWLALSGSISVEAFVYPNEGERFSRRPARKLNVRLKFPSVIRLATTVSEISEQARESQNGEQAIAVPANLDLQQEQDLLVLLNNRIEVFLNSIEPEPSNDAFLGSLGYNRQRDDYEIDIKELIDNATVSGDPRLSAVEGREADLSISLNESLENGDIIPARLNNDEHDDIFVFTGQDSSHIRGLLLLSDGL